MPPPQVNNNKNNKNNKGGTYCSAKSDKKSRTQKYTYQLAADADESVK